MNKKNGAILFSLCTMFVACNDYLPTGVPEITDDNNPDATIPIETIYEYTRNFVARYGNIDPNHTWGFGYVNSMTTRGETVNSNRYPSAPIGCYDEEYKFNEVEFVKTIFESKQSLVPTYFNYGTYFVQHVYSKETDDTYYFAARDYKQGDYSQTNETNPTDKPEITSGFNSKNESKYMDKEEDGHAYAFFTNMGYGNDNAEQFAYIDKDGKRHTDYIIIMVQLPNGENSYYLGFNMSGSENPNYSDWIVKLTPVGNNNSEQNNIVRIMCEDLGSTSDFDFNDIVFDVDISSYQKVGDKYSVDIIVQAAGGTLPVYIGNVHDPRNEVHMILGGTSNTPINVGLGASVPAKYKTITGLSSDQPKDIPLYRKDTGNGTSAMVLIPSNRSKTAPFKICVPVTTQWTVEHGEIGKAYAGFREWVESETNNNAGFNDGNAWTNKEGGDSKLLMPANPQ